MELVKILWVVIFFLFSLNLIFIWSKIYVISKRVQTLSAHLKKVASLEKEFQSDQKSR